MSLRRSSNLQTGRSSQARSKLLWLNLLMIISIVGIVVSDAIMTNAQVAVGAPSSSLYQQRLQLTNKVSHLRWQVAQNKSLQRIQSQATADLGMESIDRNLLHLQSPYLTHDHDQEKP